jgi:vacuolar-type H+-ATPase subunit C/Vma6
MFSSTCTSLTWTYSYIEGIVRGYRNALLTSVNYSNLTQCENIDGRLLNASIFNSLTCYRRQATAVASLR